MEFWRRNLYILWGTQFLAMIGMNLVVPFLPFFVRELGVTDANEAARWSGLVFAGPFLTAFFSTPLWGKLGDTYGKKAMVIRALVGLGLSQILVGFSTNVYELLFFRLLQGAISGFIAAALALVTTSTPKEHTGYSLGFLQSATAGGTVLGPVVGGLLADTLGYRPIFFIVAGLCFTCAIVILKFVREVSQPKSEQATATIFQNATLMITDKRLRIVGIAIVLSQSAALMIEPLFALFIEQFTSKTQYLSTITGAVVSIAGVFTVISAPWWGKRNDRIGFKKNLVVALSGTGVAYALHLVVPNVYALGGLRAGLGFARGGILHSLYSQVSLYAPDSRKSGLIGIASSLAILGNFLGPVIGGMIAGTFGLSAVFIVNSCIFLFIAYLIHKFLAETKPQHVEVKEALDVVE